MKDIDEAVKHFKELLNGQLERLEKIKGQEDFINYGNLENIVIGICDGDGIGPIIVDIARKILNFILRDEIQSKKLIIKNIEGLTIENRSKLKCTVPQDTLEAIKSCDVFLKGPTTTPRKGDSFFPLESANVFLRRELDLFANVRPIKIKELGIDWVFFRENTEGAYTLGSFGVEVSQLAIDFKVATDIGVKRIARAAFSYAEKTNRKRVTIITKANIIKKTDGKFLNICKEIGKEFNNIEVDDLYVDIASAKLLDLNQRKKFSVFLLPNLYGDILTDEAAQIQGGVGTAGSANIGKRYAMFEAVHGSAVDMIEKGLSLYVDPTSILRALALLLAHIGYTKQSKLLDDALDIANKEENKVRVNGTKEGATTEEFYRFLIDILKSKII